MDSQFLLSMQKDSPELHSFVMNLLALKSTNNLKSRDVANEVYKYGLLTNSPNPGEIGRAHV